MRDRRRPHLSGDVVPVFREEGEMTFKQALTRASIAFAFYLAVLTLTWMHGRTVHAQGVRDAQPTNHSIKITTGLTYQAIAIPLNDRVSVTFQNNVGNTSTDVCYIDITGKVAAGNTTSTNVTVDGVTMTSAQASITLSNGGSYGRYTASVPGGVAVVGTCTTTGDAIYIDTQ
jgi:hypothetical protein